MRDEQKRPLTLGQIREAQRKVKAGEATSDDMETNYPGYQKAAADLDKTMESLSKLALGPDVSKVGETVLASLNQSWKDLADVVVKSGQIRMPMIDEPLVRITSPVDATERLRADVQELNQITTKMATSIESMARIGQASLAQTGAVVALLAGGEKRNNLVIGLTRALLILTAVLVIPALHDLWIWSEPARSLLWTWLQTR